MSFDSWEWRQDFELNAIVDVRQAFEILQNAGAEAFVVYFTLEALQSRNELTVSHLAEYTGLSLSEVQKACYHLGLELLGVRQDETFSV